MGALVQRGLPCDLEAEKSVLGSVLVDSDKMLELNEVLEADNFFDVRHKEVYVAMGELFAKNVPIDAITVIDQLRKTSKTESFSEELVWELARHVPTSAHCRHYAEIVKEKSKVRHLILSCTDVIEMLYQDQDFDAACDLAESKVFSMTQFREQEGVACIEELMAPVFEHLQEIHSSKGQSMGIETGFFNLNEMTSGFQNGELNNISGSSFNG